MHVDAPKCLQDEAQCQARRSLLHNDHVRPLTEFVDRLCNERGPKTVPYFDPLDGGVNAACLFLLEAPGRKAIASGFVSRNNPDETAKNWFELDHEADIHRSRTIMWNIVPWYLGNGTKIRAARVADIKAGLPYLQQLLALLPKLRLIVLVGRKAGRAREWIQETSPNVGIIELPHPSPMFINRAAGNRKLMLHRLAQVRSALD